MTVDLSALTHIPRPQNAILLQHSSDVPVTVRAIRTHAHRLRTCPVYGRLVGMSTELVL